MRVESHVPMTSPDVAKVLCNDCKSSRICVSCVCVYMRTAGRRTYIYTVYVYRRDEANGIGAANCPYVVSTRYVNQIGDPDPVIVSHVRFNREDQTTKARGIRGAKT